MRSRPIRRRAHSWSASTNRSPRRGSRSTARTSWTSSFSSIAGATPRAFSPRSICRASAARRASALTFLDRSARFPIDFPAANRLAFVVRLLALDQRQRHLHAPFLQIHAQRHKREALLDDAAGELADLLTVQQQLP